ncbi:hypothetical protein KKP04_04225 [Rhodomicrobium sp. Az07]|uniref:hypothetical protein n=1 Tax=Rhodomicrobium sp. Az07 TaxID=2839034 RepID=UPI001BE5EC2A|nr:hypothetical protein [Rhodomicrobium sp. Az07]MBT3070074.1 hypothetical protein [Rhodomicrobium sp. Az07]
MKKYGWVLAIVALVVVVALVNTLLAGSPQVIVYAAFIALGVLAIVYDWKKTKEKRREAGLD